MEAGRSWLVGLGALAVLALVLAVAWSAFAPEERPSVATPRGAAAERGTRRTPSAGTTSAAADGTSARSGREPGDLDDADEGTVGAPDRAAAGAEASSAGAASPRRTFASPEEREAFVGERVLDLLATIAPEIDPATVDRACSADGRDCTFEGPWPGDDLFARWTKAIALGRTGPDAMEGVTFTRFAPEGEGDERIFVLEAHAP